MLTDTHEHFVGTDGRDVRLGHRVTTRARIATINGTRYRFPPVRGKVAAIRSEKRKGYRVRLLVQVDTGKGLAWTLAKVTRRTR